MCVISHSCILVDVFLLEKCVMVIFFFLCWSLDGEGKKIETWNLYQRGYLSLQGVVRLSIHLILTCILFYQLRKSEIVCLLILLATLCIVWKLAYIDCKHQVYKREATLTFVCPPVMSSILDQKFLVFLH